MFLKKYHILCFFCCLLAANTVNGQGCNFPTIPAFNPNPTMVMQQTEGGREIYIKPRPDIADSAYQLFYRVDGGRRSSSFYPIYDGEGRFTLTNSCQGKFFDFFIPLAPPYSHYATNPGAPYPSRDTTHNPITGDSTLIFYHKLCNPVAYPINTIVPDSFAYMMEYWENWLFYLPYKCDTWQISKVSDIRRNRQWDASTNVSYACPPNALKPYQLFGAYNNGRALIAYDTAAHSKPLVQFSNVQKNSMPGFASNLDFIVHSYAWASLQMNPIDPEGDSLVFSSSENLTDTRTVNYRGANLASYGAILPHAVVRNATSVPPYWDTIAALVDTAHARYNCIPGQSGPGCTRYNAQSNPFDCDSTFSVNPSTGEIRFFTKTPNQHFDLTIKCDEYRQGAWLSTSYRVIRVHTVDSGYVSAPEFIVDTANVLGCTTGSNLSFYACAGNEITIPFDVIEPQGLGNLTVTDNHNVSIPSSGVVYSNNGTDSVHGVFGWQTLPTDSGWYNVIFTITDSACSVSNYIQSTNRVMKIYIGPNYNQTIQLNICSDTMINGVLYTRSGLYTQNYNSFIGCDSNVSFDLTRYTVDTSISYGPNHSLTAGATSATYQWLDCGTLLPIPGATNASYTATQWGKYACIVTQNGCTDTSECKLLMVAPKGVADYSILSRLYPNPSKKSYRLVLDKNYGDVQLEIRTMSGQLVWSQNFRNLKETTLTLNEPSGVYMLYIKQENRTFVKKLMKY